MSLHHLFPKYPLKLKTPTKSKFRFETRNIYVDFPWPFYHLLRDIMMKSFTEDLTRKRIEKIWQVFMEKYKDDMMFKGKPLGTIFVRNFQNRLGLRLHVKWDLFVEYLEEKARNFSLEIEKNGRNIKNLYKHIWNNFFKITEERIFPQTISHPDRKFKKLLKRTGDYQHLMKLLERFEGNLDKVMKLENVFPPVKLYITHMLMDLYHLRTLIDSSNIVEAYLLLRNFLETLVKFVVYIDIGLRISIDPGLILHLLFKYEYEAVQDFKKKERFLPIGGKGKRRDFIDVTSRKLMKIFFFF